MKNKVPLQTLLTNKLSLLDNQLVTMLPSQNYNIQVITWIKRYIEIIESLTYSQSNINDMLWFYNHGLEHCKKIVDIGTGGGYIPYLLSFLIKQIDAYEYIGDWVDQEMKSADYITAFSFSQNIIKNMRKNVTFKFYQNFPLKEKSQTYDGIILYAVIEHIEPTIYENFFAEIYRVLKPSGNLYIAKLPRVLSYQEYITRTFKLGSHSRLYTKPKIAELLDKYKFKIKYIEQTGLFFNHPNTVTNGLFPITNKLEHILSYSPFKLFAHDYRIIAGKK